jgi:hypothetical protein
MPAMQRRAAVSTLTTTGTRHQHEAQSIAKVRCLWRIDRERAGLDGCEAGSSLKQLKAISYRGCVNLEYEINVENPLPGMLHSMGYLRGVLAGLAGQRNQG